MVEEEVRELVAGTFLESAPLVRTSANTGSGLDELRALLRTAADDASNSPRADRLRAPFRMPIDRSFTITGHGAVVTGSVVSGVIAVGDELVVQPSGRTVRVRGIQNHDDDAASASRGQRAAINLAGIRHDEIERGQELAAVGYLASARVLTVKLEMLASAPRPLKDRARVRLHCGSGETLATVRLWRDEPLARRERCVAQLLLDEPVATIWNQPFVIRAESPVCTIGGGHVLDPSAPRLRRPTAADRQSAKDLQSTDPLVRCAAAIFFLNVRSWSPVDLARQAGVDDPQSQLLELLEREQVRAISLSTSRVQHVHRDVIEELSTRVHDQLAKMHDAEPLRSMLDRSQLIHRFDYLENTPLLNAVLTSMERGRRIRLTEAGIGLADRGPRLSQGERKLLAELLARFQVAGIESPTVEQCQRDAAKNKASIPQLLQLAAADGDLIQVAPAYFLHRDCLADVQEAIAERLVDGKGLTLSEIREILNTTRKYAVPLCEHLDKIGFTKRQGDLRLLSNR